MKRLLRNLSIGLLLGAGLLVPVASPAVAIDVFDGCSGNDDTAVCEASGTDDANTLVRDLVSLSLWALGVVAVIVIVISGFKFTTANGDQAKVASAKNTILYAVIGLVVAMLAQAIVIFVIDWTV